MILRCDTCRDYVVLGPAKTCSWCGTSLADTARMNTKTMNTASYMTHIFHNEDTFIVEGEHESGLGKDSLQMVRGSGDQRDS